MSGIAGRKSDSGAAKRKRKKEEAVLVASMQGSLLRHLKSVKQSDEDHPTIRTDHETESIDNEQLKQV